MESLADHVLVPCPECGKHLVPVYIHRSVVRLLASWAVEDQGKN